MKGRHATKEVSAHCSSTLPRIGLLCFWTEFRTPFAKETDQCFHIHIVTMRKPTRSYDIIYDLPHDPVQPCLLHKFMLCITFTANIMQRHAFGLKHQPTLHSLQSPASSVIQSVTGFVINLLKTLKTSSCYTFRLRSSQNLAKRKERTGTHQGIPVIVTPC